ncbi:hypothetical protein [Gilvibacter sp.]|uniref:hypothetical protein n=1 Tax=Gilvibacter sp. TaxID=2729997 RepID=UPI0025BD1AF3|nr:hypothetical protein [Gilvibacter sp.]NQX76436.1 hypothetical protein [Gilvibacter sp.]
MRQTILVIVLLICQGTFAQDGLRRSIRVAKSDSIAVDSVSINPSYFEVFSSEGTRLDQTDYEIDFTRATLRFNSSVQSDSIEIRYQRYPEFLTRRYANLDPNLIVSNSGNIDRLYSLQQATTRRNSTPFQGLNANGSITRGVTIGNNQNAVVNSELDLQITGRLSEKVSIRASIQDANIPTQEGGYSQNLDEFDQIFVELYGKNWNIRAGDINLNQSGTYFGNFTKKIQGISIGGTLTHKDSSETHFGVAGALVRGVFSRSTFAGQEGNQGPYKLVGPNGELFILIISGSERVFVNGLLLERGENKDYVIDYNAGEVRFNPTFPINASMRIVVEYQFTDRNYTRFIGYGNGGYSNDNFQISAYAYSESDAKNQPLQQNLTEEQVGVLQNAGDDLSLMNAPSAVPDTFSENKILYRRETIAGIEAFVFSDNPDDELFNVRFSFVGANNGNYVIQSENTISRIFEFVPPVGGVPQGDYEPVVPLVAPTLLQVGGIHGSYSPTKKTQIGFELSASRNDRNLFSDIDDNDNNGLAARLTLAQALVRKDSLATRLDAFANINYLQEEYQSIERLFNVEFTRDWNLLMPTGDQTYAIGGLEGALKKWGAARYEFQYLDFDGSFNGSRHVLNSNLLHKNTQAFINASVLSSSGDSLKSDFARVFVNTRQNLGAYWVGGKFNFEDNQQRATPNDSLTPLSQKFTEYQAYAGVGDSTKVYVEIGYINRVTDSVVSNQLQRVASAESYYAKTKIFNTQATQLSLIANYRRTRFDQTDMPDEQVLNGRLSYNQRLWKGAVVGTTLFESNSGVIPQQEFTYVAVEPGQGIYTWNDYNENGIQELDEFEIAQFQDEAEYVRVLLPNRTFVPINQNAFSQSITLQPKQWANSENKFKKILSQFYNQASYLIDRSVRRNEGRFKINPFEDAGDDQLGLQLNFKNVLFFNRGKQRYTTSYTYLSTANKNLLATGLQENRLSSHQLNFNHKIGTFFLLNARSTWSDSESLAENFPSRNFEIQTETYNPKLSYLWNKTTRLDVGYTFTGKSNALGEEALDQHRFTVLFAYNKSQNSSITAEFNYIDNSFSGSAFSPVAYQILEGLQPGTNFTWNLLLQQKITKYLDANLSYFGRKSEQSKAIHTGSVQLRAFF